MSPDSLQPRVDYVTSGKPQVFSRAPECRTLTSRILPSQSYQNKRQEMIVLPHLDYEQVLIIIYSIIYDLLIQGNINLIDSTSLEKCPMLLNQPPTPPDLFSSLLLFTSNFSSLKCHWLYVLVLLIPPHQEVLSRNRKIRVKGKCLSKAGKRVQSAQMQAQHTESLSLFLTLHGS